MKGRWITLLLAWLAPISLFALASAQAIERPELSAEDTWVYRVYEGGNLAHVGSYESTESFTVLGVLPRQWGLSTGYQMSHSLSAVGSEEAKKNNHRISRDLNGYARQSPSSAQQEVRWLQWPLEPGRSWRFERPIAAGIQIWETNVKGWEEVEVPAGKFRTLRVVIDLVANPNPLVTWQVTMWYSPEVKAFVKKTDYGQYEASVPIKRDTRELKSYQLH